MKIKHLKLVPVALFGLSAPFAMADSISPSTYMATLDVGESTTITKTVTVDEGAPTSSKVDVYFLADTTGSMGGAINNVKASAADILASTSALGDVAYGVGYYSGEVGDDSYGLYQGITSNTTDVTNAINMWAACVPNCGGDGPEANIYGLFHAADDAATGWRAGSERILVWFGDAVGHDPSPGGGTPSDGKKTEADATAALIANGINVQAVNVGGMDNTGQATRITDATGGTLYNGISSSEIANTIKDAISTAISEYSSVALDTSAAPAGVSVGVVPGSHDGDFDRSETRTFEFEVTFTGVTPGHYEFPIYATVDGGRVAVEDDKIWVGTPPDDPPTGVPDGGRTALLFGLALAALGAVRRWTAARRA